MDTNNLSNFDNRTFEYFSNPSVIEKDLQTLVGIIHGIKSDRVISEKESSAVLNWLNSYKQYENKQPYKEVISIIRDAFADNILTHDEAENIIWFCNQYIKRTMYFNEITSGIQRLIGIMTGIAIDDKINFKELEFLDKWLEDNSYLKNTYPYDEIYNLATNIIQDKIITSDEHHSLLSFCKAFVDDNNTNSAITPLLKTGFYQIDPSIIIAENTFCITGVSKKYKRKELAEKIELLGGYITENVSSKLNYLIVCDDKNSCWAFTCYGRKIEDAMKHRKQGASLVIVHEFDLYDLFESLS